VTGDVFGARFEERINCGETIIGSDALQALFAFETIRAYERSKSSDDLRRARIVALSIESGVLSNETAFIGFCAAPPPPPPVVYRSRKMHGSLGGPIDPTPVCPASAAPPRFACFDVADDTCACDFGFLDDLFGADPPQRPAAVTPKGDPVLELAAQQNVDGSWESAEQLRSVAGVEVDCPSDLSVSPSVFATLLGIAILRTKFSGQRNQWRMIERKALQWLRDQIGDAAAEAAIDRLARLCQEQPVLPQS
jgi:hypothetical protein